MGYSVFLHNILRVEDIGSAQAIIEFTPELVKRGMVLICTALDLYRANQIAFSHKEVDLQTQFITKMQVEDMNFLTKTAVATIGFLTKIDTDSIARNETLVSYPCTAKQQDR